MDRITGSYIKQADVIPRRGEIKKLLDKLYDAGINHGDMHNRNIILDDDGRIWIIDYGSATEFEGSDRDYVVNITQELGDPHSMYRPIYVN
jgi:predicted unusual protein kinase regulating ubiquinone biosynthesis (AarF/ABC1/UbiB family)